MMTHHLHRLHRSLMTTAALAIATTSFTFPSAIASPSPASSKQPSLRQPYPKEANSPDPNLAKPSQFTRKNLGYDNAWTFTCTWDCGIASFAPEYGGHTVHGYSDAFFDELPSSEAEAKEWAYYDFWLPAGCDGFSTNFARTVCFDTAFFHGIGAWQYFASLHWYQPDDELACRVIDERAAARDPNSPYVEGWNNRDASLAALGPCR